MEGESHPFQENGSSSGFLPSKVSTRWFGVSDKLALHVRPIPPYSEGTYLRDHFSLDDNPPWTPRWNIAPTPQITTIRQPPI
jgi:hypothetical protein